MIHSFVRTEYVPETWKEWLLVCLVMGIFASICCIPITITYIGSMFGIGCDARDQKAIDRINSLKRRTIDSGYIVLLSDFRKFQEFSNFLF